MKQWSLFFRLAVVLISFLGILDAGYITWNEVFDLYPPCKPPFACRKVLDSVWSYIGPIPLSGVGLLYYITVFVLGVLYFLDSRIVILPKRVVFRTHDFLFFLTSMGMVFSLYLVFVMGFVLQAWCLYCIFSAVFSMLLFFLNLVLHHEAVRVTPIPSFRRAVFALFYRTLCKPIFFLLDAEFVHNAMTWVGKILGRFTFTRFIIRALFDYSDPRLYKTLSGITFPNPVGLSAGFDYNGQLTDIIPAVGFGFVTLGTVTLDPHEGNAKPRLGRFPRSCALLVNKGFRSIGAKAIINQLEGKKFAIPIGISIGSTNKKHRSRHAQIDDILKTFYAFEHSLVRHSYYELNISCPNTTGGQPFTQPDHLQQLLSRLDSFAIQKPIFLKMPIDLTDEQTLSLLEVTNKHSIAGVVFGNLTKDKQNPDVDPQEAKQWKAKSGNLSGKPTWNRSNHYIHLTRQIFGPRFTIIGTGGIFSPEDAAYKLNLGADLVQLITGMIYEGPQLIGEINEALVTRQ